MPELLLELFSEEIPARMIDEANQELQKRVAALLTNSHLPYENIGHAATPRRSDLSESA